MFLRSKNTYSIEPFAIVSKTAELVAECKGLWILSSIQYDWNKISKSNYHSITEMSSKIIGKHVHQKIIF